MTNDQNPIRAQTARLLGTGRRREGTLLLYPDKLIHVHSQAIRWATTISVVAVTIAAFALTHSGPGALGALIGAGVGWMIGSAIARHQAADKAAAGGDGITVIPLDSITSLHARKSAGIGGWLGGQHLLVTTADGAEHHLSVKLDKWAADLGSTLTAHGSTVGATPESITITPASSA